MRQRLMMLRIGMIARASTGLSVGSLSRRTTTRYRQRLPGLSTTACFSTKNQTLSFSTAGSNTESHNDDEAEGLKTNAALWQRRVAAIPVGIGSSTQRFIAAAENAQVQDVEQQRYIDFAGGIGVLNTGHAHPKVLSAVRRQLDTGVLHSCFQVMPYEPYLQVAERLNSLVSPAIISQKVKSMLFSTGAEAVENAVKIAKSYTKRSGILSFSGGFHGRTLLGVALTGKISPYKADFGAMPPEIHHARFPHPYRGVFVQDSIRDIQHLFKTTVDPHRIAAIVIEPIQGEGGFTVAPPEFMTYLRKHVADPYGMLLIADEVQSGFGRSGKYFAIQHSIDDTPPEEQCRPDIITMAKSIGGGLPLSAVVGRAEVMDAPLAGGLGGTYAGNPLACVAALAVMDVMEEEGILQKSNDLGHLFRGLMEGWKEDHPSWGIGEIRGLGAMVAFELVQNNSQKNDNEPDPDRAKAVVQLAAERGLILLSCGMYGNTIRVLVPITVEEEVFREGMDILKGVLRDTVLEER